MPNEAISLRPVNSEDEAFLLELYRSTRAAEMAAWGWDNAQQELFLKMQLKARDRSYRMYYPKLDDRIILLRGAEVGRLITHRTENEIRLVEISLLPAQRRQGIGTDLIRELFLEADAAGQPLRLQVEKTNTQARSLYERLGFTLTGENQICFHMERKAVLEG